MMEITNEDNMQLMARYPDKYFDLAIVDPPYGIGYDIEQNKQALNNRISNGGKWKQYKKTNWDNKAPNSEYWNQLFRVSKNQIIWGGNYFHEVNLSGIIVWNKGRNGNMKEGELAKTSFNTFRHFDCSRIDAYVNNGEDKIHPTQKPIPLYKWILDKYAKPNDKILDTHLGSGSIAIACHDYGFDLTACELDKDYFDAAMKRLRQHQAQTKLF